MDYILYSSAKHFFLKSWLPDYFPGWSNQNIWVCGLNTCVFDKTPGHQFGEGWGCWAQSCAGLAVSSWVQHLCHFQKTCFFHHTFPSSGIYILHPLPFWNVLWPLRMGSTLHHHLVLTLWAATGFSLNGHSPQQCEASLVKAGCLSQSLINRQWEQVLNIILFFFQTHNSKIYAILFLRVGPVTLSPNFSNTWLALAYSVGLASNLPVLHIF